MTSQHLEQLLDSITRVRIAVIGDFCLDAYWFLDPAAGEVSLESKLLTRAVARQHYSPVGVGDSILAGIAAAVAAGPRPLRRSSMWLPE